jgi:hypothetical protein
MVHPPVQPLLALALTGLESAKWLFVCRLAAHVAALLFAIAAALCAHWGHHHHDDPFAGGLEVVAALAAVGCEVLAQWVHHRALELHSHGRAAMRRVLLLDALEPADAALVLARVRHHFGGAVQQRAAALQVRDQKLPPDQQYLANYYFSDEPLGLARLRDHLLESAIFSHHLYAAARKLSLGLLLVFLALGAAVVFVLFGGLHPWLADHQTARLLPADFSTLADMGLLVLQGLIVLVAFVPTSQEVEHLLLYKIAEHQLADLLPRLERLYTEPLAADALNRRLLAGLGDYGAATTFAPPIRTWVYRKKVVQLRDEFEQLMRRLKGPVQPAPPTGGS